MPPWKLIFSLLASVPPRQGGEERYLNIVVASSILRSQGSRGLRNQLLAACSEPGKGKGVLHVSHVINFSQLCQAHDPIL